MLSKCHVKLASSERNEKTEPWLAVTKTSAKYFSALPNLEAYTCYLFKNNVALLHLSLAT